MTRRRSSVLGLLCLVALPLCSCGADPTDPGEGNRNPFGNTFQDLFSDMRKVDLGDLVSVGADLATRQVNQQLGSLPYLSIQLSPTALFALKDQAKNDLTLKDLDGLTAGLAARYGDNDFITHVNALRARHLRENPGRLFAEASFKMEGKLGQSFAFDAAGLPGQVGLLASKGIRTTVIAPYKGELRSVLEGPLDAIVAARGFVLPESVDHILAMVPGESIARESDGVVGFNVGLGLPIYLTSIQSAATLHAVISAGARATLGGELDIQLVRDAEQTAVVDVGVTGQTARAMNVAVETRWGLAGLPTLELNVGPIHVDVASVAQKALEDLLNRRLSPFAAGYNTETATVRHTVARFAFDLSQRSDAVEQALIQAWRGDLRLA